MKTGHLAFPALAALVLTGCSIDQDGKTPVRPPDRPVAPLAKIAAATGQQLTRKCAFTKYGYTLLYRLHSPDCIPGVVYPLVLFLHGSGERGSDNDAQLAHGVAQICRYAMRHGDAFVAAPQCPKNRAWITHDWSRPTMTRLDTPTEEMAAVMSLLRELVATLPVDTSRIYATGISMGGYGTWDIASRMPGFLAAAMPVCGGADENAAELYRGLPLMFFHGELDTAVPVEYSRRMDRALSDAGIGHVYKEYPKTGHKCWVRTYSDDSALDWLFAQERRENRPVASR